MGRILTSPKVFNQAEMIMGFYEFPLAVILCQYVTSSKLEATLSKCITQRHHFNNKPYKHCLILVSLWSQLPRQIGGFSYTQGFTPSCITMDKKLCFSLAGIWWKNITKTSLWIGYYYIHLRHYKYAMSPIFTYSSISFTQTPTDIFTL